MGSHAPYRASVSKILSRHEPPRLIGIAAYDSSHGIEGQG